MYISCLPRDSPCIVWSAAPQSETLHCPAQPAQGAQPRVHSHSCAQPEQPTLLYSLQQCHSLHKCENSNFILLLSILWYNNCQFLHRSTPEVILCTDLKDMTDPSWCWVTHHLQSVARHQHHSHPLHHAHLYTQTLFTMFCSTLCRNLQLNQISKQLPIKTLPT